eukprot:NODE_1164_length_2092_cov_42.196039_g980_i0.p1 GENE.NODE_1164_length_2092_cov_42.196039_g980_i0~~NODE_1164_length_2092_cov_42.196039_g980_i0.p1  ORF type:complete len:652 (-),score=94.45 NODE_1164_length_2092_cov_42.196039_g980_i0:135-2024(-)
MDGNVINEADIGDGLIQCSSQVFEIETSYNDTYPKMRISPSFSNLETPTYEPLTLRNIIPSTPKMLVNENNNQKMHNNENDAKPLDTVTPPDRQYSVRSVPEDGGHMNADDKVNEEYPPKWTWSMDNEPSPDYAKGAPPAFNPSLNSTCLIQADFDSYLTTDNNGYPSNGWFLWGALSSDGKLTIEPEPCPNCGTIPKKYERRPISDEEHEWRDYFNCIWLSLLIGWHFSWAWIQLWEGLDGSQKTITIICFPIASTVLSLFIYSLLVDFQRVKSNSASPLLRSFFAQHLCGMGLMGISLYISILALIAEIDTYKRAIVWALVLLFTFLVTIVLAKSPDPNHSYWIAGRLVLLSCGEFISSQSLAGLLKEALSPISGDWRYAIICAVFPLVGIYMAIQLYVLRHMFSKSYGIFSRAHSLYLTIIMFFGLTTGFWTFSLICPLVDHNSNILASNIRNTLDLPSNPTLEYHFLLFAAVIICIALIYFIERGLKSLRSKNNNTSLYKIASTLLAVGCGFLLATYIYQLINAILMLLVRRISTWGWRVLTLFLWFILVTVLSIWHLHKSLTTSVSVTSNSSTSAWNSRWQKHWNLYWNIHRDENLDPQQLSELMCNDMAKSMLIETPMDITSK